MRLYQFRLKEEKIFQKPFYHIAEVTYKAEVRFDDPATLAELFVELDKVKEIYRVAKKAIKDGRTFELEIIDHVIDKKDDWKTISFDRWVSVPLSDQDDTGGVYLSPDTRYTRETRDMYLSSEKTLFKDLSFTLR